MKNYSVFWARLLGLYAFILSVWCFVNIHHLYPMMSALTHTPLDLMMLGIFTIPFGLAIILSHSIWRGWPIIITILGYWITLKGIILLFFPSWINKLILFWQDKSMFLAPIPAFFIGLVLLYCGFFANKKS